jgi:hypothetical protein
VPWVHNIKMNHHEAGWTVLDWILLIQDKVVAKTVRSSQYPVSARKFLTFWQTNDFSRRTLLHGDG